MRRQMVSTMYNIANYNDGFAKRKSLITANGVNNVVITLNRYGLFESLKDKIAPNGKVLIVM